MIERITKNEERFDNILSCIQELEISLNNFNNVKKDLSLLTKYYESKNWLKDKDAYENNVIPKIKAGVLSEDGVWNMLEDINELMNEMKRTIKTHERNR